VVSVIRISASKKVQKDLEQNGSLPAIGSRKLESIAKQSRPNPVLLKLMQTGINKMLSAYDLFKRANHGISPIAEQHEMAVVTAFSEELR
jgi:hypothetical protein